MCRLSLKWRSSILRYCRFRPFGAGIFKTCASFVRCPFVGVRHSARGYAPALLNIGSMSPPGYPSAWLPPGRACLRFTRQVHCSSTSPDRAAAGGIRSQSLVASIEVPTVMRMVGAEINLDDIGNVGHVHVCYVGSLVHDHDASRVLETRGNYHFFVGSI